MKYSLDRFENGFAVLENDNREFINIEKSLLPDKAREGSVLIMENGAWRIDLEEEKARKERIKSLEERLFK